MHWETCHLSNTTIPERFSDGTIFTPFSCSTHLQKLQQKDFYWWGLREVLIIIKLDTKATLILSSDTSDTFSGIISRNGIYRLVLWQLASDPDRSQASAIWCWTCSDLWCFSCLSSTHEQVHCSVKRICIQPHFMFACASTCQFGSYHEVDLQSLYHSSHYCNHHLLCIEEILFGCAALSSYQTKL